MSHTETSWPPAAHQRLRSFLLVTIVLLAAAFILLFYGLAFARFRFPLQLEWLEGGVLDTTLRAVHGQTIYPAPSFRFVPNIYTPLYFYVAQWALRLGGANFASLRLFGIGCTSGCLLVIFLLTRAISRNNLAGFAASGLFAALYGTVDGWYDLARTDMLFLLMTLIAIALSYRGAAVLAALAFVLAYQTKQAAAPIAVCVLLHELQRPRKLVAGLGTFLVVGITSILLLDRATGGWYRYYTLTVPSHHALVPRELVAFLTKDICAHFGLTLGIACLTFVCFPGDRLRNRPLLLLAAAGLGTFLSALSSRLHSGGSVNVLLPLYAWFCIVFGVSIATVVRQRTSNTALSQGISIVVLFMAAMQLFALVYPVDKLVISNSARQDAQLAVKRIAAVRGDIYVLGNCFDVTPLGRTPYANSVAVFDVLRADHGPAAETLKRSIEAAIASRSFAAVVAPGELTAGSFYAGSSARLAEDYQSRPIPVLNGRETGELEPPLQPNAAPEFIYTPATGVADTTDASVPFHPD